MARVAIVRRGRRSRASAVSELTERVKVFFFSVVPVMKIMKPSHRCSPLKPIALTLSAVLWDSVETNQMREVARATRNRPAS